MIKKSSLLILILTLLVPFTLTATELKQAQVTRVIDGDTIEVKLEVGTAKVRYIGIDTPETHGGVEHYGKEATNYNKALVRNKTVWLEIGEEARDKYDRLLAYIYLDPAQKSMVNAILVAQGFAEVMTIEPNDKHADLFEDLVRDAKQDNRGMWGEEDNQSTENNSNDVASCQSALNNATQEDFEEVSGIGEGIADRLVKAQPFEGCNDVDCLQVLLKDVSYVGPTRSEDILTHFCPNLVE